MDAAPVVGLQVQPPVPRCTLYAAGEATTQLLLSKVPALARPAARRILCCLMSDRLLAAMHLQKV
jgi:hypothetical protein